MCAKAVADNLSKILRIKESCNSYGICQKYEHVPQQIDISKKGGA